MKECGSETDRVRAWASGAREASKYIGLETAKRLAEETPGESFKALLDLFAFHLQTGARDESARDDDREMKIRIGQQMAKLPRG